MTHLSDHLYYGDNLQVLRDSIANESVDLIYLDPPFNSNATYNVLFQGPAGGESAAQVEAFSDTWHWGESAEAAYDAVLGSGSAAAEMLRPMRAFLGENDMMAYLAMMAVRLVELHRVLKPTGSLYLHCDSTASHYLKILLDAVFGAKHYRNEVIWKRATSHNNAKRFGRITDRLLFYTKSDNYCWNADDVREPRSEEELRKAYPLRDGQGRYRSDNLTAPGKGGGELRREGRYRSADLTAPGKGEGTSGDPWRGYDVASRGRSWAAPKSGTYADYIDAHIIPGYKSIEGVHDRLDALDEAGLISHPQKGFWPGLKRYAEADLGKPIQDLILHPIGFTNYSSQRGEYLGYPTQKPLGLLKKFILVSSNPGDVVLDPFCGCGTTVHAAQKLGRRWIGIDITHLAVRLIERRLQHAFPPKNGMPQVQYATHGVPKDLEGAQRLADDDKYEFEKWALSLIGATPGTQGKKGADGGFDGNLYFGKPAQRAVVSVKGGRHVGVGMVRELDSVRRRVGAEVGILLTLTPPTKPMTSEAAAAGLFKHERFAPVPRVQIITIETALAQREGAVTLPARLSDPFKKAPEEEDPTAQGALEL